MKALPVAPLPPQGLKNNFEIKNPFADFTSFESKITNMQPIQQDSGIAELTQKV